MIIWIIFITFIMLFILPFIPGFIEMVRKEDADPLYISMDYIRNPRYFASSFKQILHSATDGFTLDFGTHDVKLSKEEVLKISPPLYVPDDEEIDHLLYIKGNLISGANVKFGKEVYLTENAVIGPDNVIQAFLSDSSVKVMQGVKIQRWLDAEGDIDFNRNCNLGISVTSGNKLYLAENCVFRRLYGMPVTTSHKLLADKKHLNTPSPFEKSFASQSLFIRKGDRNVPPETKITGNVVFTKDVEIGHGSIFRGSIKSYGRLVLEENITVDGNIFSDSDIIIGKNAKIRGHVFSQTSIYISEGTVISRPNVIKSIIAKRTINIANEVVIYGYVTTEGHGITEEKI